MKRNAKKPSLAPFVASVVVLTVMVFGIATLSAQPPQSSSPDKPQATATPATPASTTPVTSGAAKQQTPQTKSAGMVWVNTDTGVYHKQGTRWYGKTKKGKYMLEADAIKAGYKPAK